jgi:hypothetical protein
MIRRATLVDLRAVGGGVTAQTQSASPIPICSRAATILTAWCTSVCTSENYPDGHDSRHSVPGS